MLNIPFNDKLPVTQLHWIILDSKEFITGESVKEVIKIYENPIGVLTNNPSFNMQIFVLNNYMNLSTKSPEDIFVKGLKLKQYSRGRVLGLPGIYHHNLD